MSNSPDLKRLRDNREEILKAELAAWLHDVGKFSSKHIEHTLDGGSFKWECDHSYKMVVDNPSSLVKLSSSVSSVRKPDIINEIFRTRCLSSVKAANFLQNDIKDWMTNETLGSYAIAEIIILGTPGFATSPHRSSLLDGKDGWLPAILGVSHHVAHHEKPEFRSELKPQKYSRVYLDSPFGFSYFSLDVSKRSLENCIYYAERHFQNYNFRRAKRVIRKCFGFGWGDTRFPLNEVDLESWSLIVASLFKSQFAQFLSTGKRTRIGQWKSWRDKIIDTDAAWRLLSIRADGLEYLLSANSIPDLLARKDLLTDAWNRVQTLLEETYPLGLEVHRDENGPVFVVPDIDNLLGLTDSDHNNQTLREFILEAFRQGTVKKDPCLALAGEIVPHFKLDEDAWDGQSKLPPIGKDHLKETPSLQTDPQWVARQWCNLPKPQEVCTVCGLRPQGPGKKARDRKMCAVCEKRREERAKEWAANIGRAFLSTIWLDEVADKNGRLALIVGTFDLTHWLDGTLVRSLAVRTPNDQNGHTAEDVAKNPSFARLRRIWETTRRFWGEILDQAKSELSKCPRLFLKGAVPNGSLGPYHAYELEIQGRKVAVLWVPEQDDEVDIPEKYRGGFWVIENLDYLKSTQIFGRDLREILEEGGEYHVYEPSEYGRPGESTAIFALEKVLPEKEPDDKITYLPLIPILAEPRTFMALVPAASAFDVLKAIKAKYEREMGKVRNRLPLHLGVVFADAHQPLHTILDAGRRMLEQKEPEILWEVRNIKRFGQPNNPNETKGWRALRLLKQQDLLAHHPNQFRVMVSVHLRNNGRELIWHVLAVMGDGQTEDHWYPYVFWVQDKEGNTEPANATKKRDRYYQAPNPFDMDDAGNPQPAWLVHAADLQPGDRIYFTPATFDFLWLDHGGRRFEIAYDGRGVAALRPYYHRRGTLHRPYLLDELPNLERCWNLLDQGLGTRQIHQVRDLIETRRAQWFPDDLSRSLSDPTFRQFCAAVLRNAEWQKNAEAKQGANMQRLIQWAVDGTLADAVELFYHIMKKSRGDTERAEETP